MKNNIKKMKKKYLLGIGLLMCALIISGVNILLSPHASAQVNTIDPSTHKDKDDDDKNSSCECDGKISTLTLKYNGAGSPTIKVDQKKEGTIFEQTVASGGQFTIQGIDNKGTLGTQISIYVDGVLNTQIHTSCSVEINIGQTFGSFTITNGQSRNNGKLCVAGSGGGNENSNSNSNSNTNEGNENENENNNENENENGNTNENEPGTDIPEVSYPALFGIAGGSMIIGLLIGLTLKSKSAVSETQKSRTDENKENSEE